MNFSSLPTPIKAGASLATGGSLLGAGYILASGSAKVMIIVGIGLAVVAVLFGIYLLFLKWMQKRQAGRMNKSLGQHNTGAPASISDPNQRVMLDDLRKKFDDGVQKFRQSGKDIYSLPWYMVVGEPGAGKTEAIRHSNVGFPPGLQDELQGAGGTVNMNWWFTNYAVFLDTAGRLLFEDVAPGSTNEWKEFLRLLRKNRPNCPVNGMTLVIPADSLIKDTADELERKAKKIAYQLDEIQRELDVRFPVFVLITKCDLVHGFREFFENLSDPNLQHQMVGWSNPDPIDTPFRPETVDERLKSLTANLRRRGLGLLQDPVPFDVTRKRIDEVDSLYDFPGALGALYPRLRRYLELIFVAGEWSQKPLFLRGIYFSSSMNEGAALDQELAQALGTSVDQLPEDKAWERERAFFLRDCFVEKAFKERNLVTRATNAKSQLKRRNWVVLIAGFLALGGILGLSWFGSKNMQEGVGEQRDFWKYAHESRSWKDGYWNPRIVRPRDDRYLNGVRTPLNVEGEDVALLAFHQKLRDLAVEEIKTPAVFKPLDIVIGAASSEDRKKAQRLVFDSGVVKPLLDAARTELASDTDPWSPKTENALAALIRFEGAVARRERGEAPTVGESSPLVEPLLVYLTGEKEGAGELTELLDWTYASGDGKGQWPPKDFSGGLSLGENRAIRAGVAKFVENARQAKEKQEGGLGFIRDLSGLLVKLQESEARFQVALTSSAPWLDYLTGATEALDEYSDSAREVDDAIDKALSEGLLDESQWFLLEKLYKKRVEEAKENIEEPFKQLDQTLQADVGADLITLDPGEEGEEPVTLFSDIRQVLEKERASLSEAINSAFSADDVTNLSQLDALFLAKHRGEEDKLFHSRRRIYEKCLDQIKELEANKSGLVGNLAKALGAIDSGIGKAREEIDEYEGAGGREFRAACSAVLDRARESRVDNLVKRYSDEARVALKSQIAFPLVLPYQENAMSPVDIERFSTQVKGISADLADEVMTAVGPDRASGLRRLMERIVSLERLASSLVRDGNAVRCRIKMPDYVRQEERLKSVVMVNNFDMLQHWVGTQWRRLNLNGLQDKRTTDGGTLGTFYLFQSEMKFHFYRTPDSSEVDASIGYNHQWMPLRLALDSGKAPRFADGVQTWEVVLRYPVGAPANSPDTRFLLIEVEIDVETPLPEKSSWPTEDWLDATDAPDA